MSSRGGTKIEENSKGPWEQSHTDKAVFTKGRGDLVKLGKKEVPTGSFFMIIVVDLLAKRSHEYRHLCAYGGTVCLCGIFPSWQLMQAFKCKIWHWRFAQMTFQFINYMSVGSTIHLLNNAAITQWCNSKHLSLYLATFNSIACDYEKNKTWLVKDWKVGKSISWLIAQLVTKWWNLSILFPIDKSMPA